MELSRNSSGLLYDAVRIDAIGLFREFLHFPITRFVKTESDLLVGDDRTAIEFAVDRSADDLNLSAATFTAELSVIYDDVRMPIDMESYLTRQYVITRNSCSTQLILYHSGLGQLLTEPIPRTSPLWGSTLEEANVLRSMRSKELDFLTVSGAIARVIRILQNC